MVGFGAHVAYQRDRRWLCTCEVGHEHEYGLKPTDAVYERLWEEFSDVPVDDEDCISTNFYHWDAGTDKEVIWHWFDERHSKGLVEGLMEKAS